ncbi:MAG TPA: hypothetical protein VM261_37275 [Kofleriaceae bacterium]|nr:hypothetical protein [Kofleriaceae bacterium]
MNMPRHASPILLAVAVVAIAATASARPAPPRLVPGTVGLTQKDLALRNSCTSTFTQVKKTKRGDDPAFVAAMTYPRITGLDLDPEKKARAKASLEKFDTWFKNLMKTMETATKAQHAILFNSATTPGAKVEAAARLSLLLDQAALIIESSEVPRNIRTYEEAVTAYCDTLAEKTEPLRAQAKEARGACAKFAAEAKLGDAWWVTVCSPDAAPALPPAPQTQPVKP